MDPEGSRLAPSVAPPRPRLRLGFVVALLLTMAGAIVVLLLYPRRAEVAPAFGAVDTPLPELRAHCTPLEVESTVRDRALDDGQRAICFAIANQIDRARAAFLAMGSAERSAAVSLLFRIAHPIADAGDDRSAGPIMELVVELWPDNYMAVFHAGMAELALGQDDRARVQLERFLQMYPPHDIWRQRAEAGLAAIAGQLPLDRRATHFPE